MHRDLEIELFQSVEYDDAGCLRRVMTELDFRQVIDRFDEILDAVERGERFRVFRDGRPIAIMEPPSAGDLDQIEVTSPAA
jgi:hypothetical protein